MKISVLLITAVLLVPHCRGNIRTPDPAGAWRRQSPPEKKIAVFTEKSATENIHEVYVKADIRAEVFGGYFATSDAALGAMLNRARVAAKLNRLNLPGWGYFLPAENTALWWSNRTVLIARTGAGNPEIFEDLFREINRGWEAPMPRASAFHLLLRPETDLKKAGYAEEQAVPGTEDLRGFFFAPWKTAGGRELTFAFREFADVRSAENFLSAGTVTGEWTLSRWTLGGHNLPVAIGEKIVFLHTGRTVLVFTGAIPEPELQKEVDQLLKSWAF